MEINAGEVIRKLFHKLKHNWAQKYFWFIPVSPAKPRTEFLKVLDL